MTTVRYNAETMRWLEGARVRVSEGDWPTSIKGPTGAPVSVAHVAQHGYCVLGDKNGITLEIAPGCFVPLNEVEVRYEG